MNRRLSTIMLLAAAVFIVSRISAVSAQSYDPCADSTTCGNGTCSWDGMFTWTCSCYSGYEPVSASFNLTAGITISGQSCVSSSSPSYSSPSYSSPSYGSPSYSSPDYSSPSYSSPSYYSSPAPPSTNTTSSSSSKGLSTGAIIGIVVGVILLLLLLGGVGLFLWFRHKNKASGGANKPGQAYGGAVSGTAAVGADLEANKGYANPYYAGGAGGAGAAAYGAAAARGAYGAAAPGGAYGSAAPGGAYGAAAPGGAYGSAGAGPQAGMGSGSGSGNVIHPMYMGTMATKHHPNLVRLLGYCIDMNPAAQGRGDLSMEQIVVYEFMARGDLERWVGEGAPQPLPVAQRLSVLIGAAHGIEYLHSFGIVHRDIKPANILLDDKFEVSLADLHSAFPSPVCLSDIPRCLLRQYEGTAVGDTRIMGMPLPFPFVPLIRLTSPFADTFHPYPHQAKVADFGLLRQNEGTTVGDTRIMGTPGYVDPAYFKSNKATPMADVYRYGVVQGYSERCSAVQAGAVLSGGAWDGSDGHIGLCGRRTPMADVYSFGILILTTMSGRNALATDENGNSFNVKKWAESLVAAGKAEELKDPRLDAPADLILRLAQLALRCTAMPTVTRPDMIQVVSELTALRKEFLGKVSSRMAERIDEEVESQRVGNFDAEIEMIEKLAFQDSTSAMSIS
ncbi:unnamed protein product [Closterium sp. Yama58-4]|nr:unnamed protein product [Closterium sp. Yama58-4]